jgi:GNAT superfamily N-acetyltransferase
VSTAPTVSTRPVRPQDVPAVVDMVYELADFEQLRHECTLTAEQLHSALFRPDPALFGHLAVAEDGEPVGVALWFLNFSTWEGVHGIYLEDLYVRPHARRSGAGRALLAALAAVCVRRGYQRLDFSVLHWNPARDFYHRLGAQDLRDWVPYRLTGEPLHALAGAAAQPAAAG